LNSTPFLFYYFHSDRIDIYDARDAIEACGGLWGEEKEECYAIFGVDPAADFWYDVVYKLETSYEMDTCT
jgi:hypothetical protein